MLAIITCYPDYSSVLKQEYFNGQLFGEQSATMATMAPMAPIQQALILRISDALALKLPKYGEHFTKQSVRCLRL